MSEFELIVDVQDENTVKARLPNGDQEVTGKMKLDSLTREVIVMFGDWLNSGRVKERREFELLGRYLYKALFDGTLEQHFQDWLSKARNAKQPLLVRLRFGNQASDLEDFPWEYLYCKPGFLATTGNLVLSRYTPLGRLDLDPERSPLRILIVISNPKGEGLVPVEGDDIIKEIQGLTSSSIQVDVLDKPTIDNFINRLKVEEKKPHVLHFIGYGRYDREEKEATIALLDDDEKGVCWIKDTDFADYFERAQHFPRLVFLDLCASATIINSKAVTATFAHLAPPLLGCGISAVVAMQYPITKDAAMVFSSYIYTALARGDSIDAAVQQGRWKIATKRDAYNDRAFGAPVLYTRSYGSIIQRTDESRVKLATKEAPSPRIAPGSSLNPSVKQDVTGGVKAKSEEQSEKASEGLQEATNTTDETTSGGGLKTSFQTTSEGASNQEGIVGQPKPLGNINSTEKLGNGAIIPSTVDDVLPVGKKRIEGLDSLFLPQNIQRYPLLSGFLYVAGKQLNEEIIDFLNQKEQKIMNRKISVLFLAANPKDTEQLRLSEEVRSIDEALQRARFRDKFDIQQQWAVRVDDLQGHLLRYEPDIVHFSGHGSTLSQIILEDNSGNSYPVPSHALSQLFSILKDNIRCVVLNACYSEQQARAIAQHIDCVVGMTKAIGDTAAISFAAAFYQALGYGRSVQTAFDLGCAQIDLRDLNQQDIPQLLVNTNNSSKITFIGI